MERCPIHEEVSLLSSLSHALIIPESLAVYRHLKIDDQQIQRSTYKVDKARSLSTPFSPIYLLSNDFELQGKQNKLTFGGVQAFQTAELMGERVVPKNRALYTDVAE